MNASTDDLFLIIGTLYTQLLLAQRQVQSLQQQNQEEAKLKATLMEEARLDDLDD